MDYSALYKFIILRALYGFRDFSQTAETHVLLVIFVNNILILCVLFVFSHKKIEKNTVFSENTLALFAEIV